MNMMVEETTYRDVTELWGTLSKEVRIKIEHAATSMQHQGAIQVDPVLFVSGHVYTKSSQPFICSKGYLIPLNAQ